MKYTTKFGVWGSVFAVPSQIVDEHLRFCGSQHLKVLLFLLRHPDMSIELDELASTLRLSPGDTQDALNYWIEAGVLAAKSGEEETELNVNAVESHAPRTLSASPQAAVAAAPKPFVNSGEALQSDEKTVETESAPTVPDMDTKPPRVRMSTAEVSDMAEHNSELKSLLSEAEAALGKTLTSADISALASLYDWAGIPVEVLLTVIEYCRQKGKTNLRYVEKVALGWQEKGVDSFEKAERYIKEVLERDAQEDICKSAFGIYDRRLTTKESEFIKSWFNDYKFDIAIVKLAYERSIEHTGKVSFAYINKVLTNWHEKNISTPEQATKDEQNFARQKNDAAKPKSSYDIDEFEAYLMRGAK